MDRDEMEEVERLVNEQILREYRSNYRRDGSRSGPRHRRHGAVRRKIRRKRARRQHSAASAASSAAEPMSAAPAISASARLSTRAAFPPECGASKPSPAKGALERLSIRQRPACTEPASFFTPPKPPSSNIWRSARAAKSLSRRQLEHSKRTGALGRSNDLEATPNQRRRRSSPQRLRVWTASSFARLPIHSRNKWKAPSSCMASVNDSNVSIISAVTKDLTAKVHAGKLVGEVAQSSRRQGRRTPRHGRRGGKESGSALPRRLRYVYQQVGAMLSGIISTRLSWWGPAHRPCLRHRVTKTRSETRAVR